MNWQDSTNGFKPTQVPVAGRELPGHAALAEPLTDDQLRELTELDDDVEALIIPMDRTTAEHLFLRAQLRY